MPGAGGVEVPFLGALPSGLSLGRLVGAVTAALLVLIVLLGIANVEITEYALNYSLVTRKVEHKTYGSGRYWIGPMNYFIKFPAVVKTIQFSDSKLQTDLGAYERGDALLRSRTSDGLDVSIELSFQYQLKPDVLYALYTELGPAPDYHNTFVRVAIDRLTEIATTFTANEFFVQRTQIGKAMEKTLNKDFEDRLHSRVFSFQLRSVGLPPEFEEAIQETEVMKQDVKVALAEQNATRVSLETQLMQAKRRTQVAANKGEAQAESVLLANTADIAQYNATQRKAADSYKGVLQALDSKEDDLLAYMEARVLRDHASDKTTIGLATALAGPESAGGAAAAAPAAIAAAV